MSDSRRLGLAGIIAVTGMGLASSVPGLAASPSDPVRRVSGAIGTANDEAWEIATSPNEKGSTNAPFSLTASDGSGLAFSALAVRTVIEGPLAFTELRMTFDNPNARTLEGRFAITLPTGASVSRFAMKIGDTWQEGEVVEKQRARVAYEDFLHRKQDPALLEMAAGNEFNARVFPIPANGRKELVLSYSQEVGATYALPLRGLPAIGSLDVVASGRDGRVYGERHTRDVAPLSDFSLRARSTEPVALRDRNVATVRVRPTVDTTPDAMTNAIILVDSSASRALGFAEQIALVRRLVATMPKDARVTVACFDQKVEVVYQGAARDYNDASSEKMKTRGALGASNVAAALAWAKGFAGDAQAKRLIMVTDGVATAGTTKTEDLSAAVASLKGVGIERLDAVAVGGMRDDVALKAMVTGGLSRHGVVAASDLDGSGLAKKLTSRTRSGIKVQVAGASWVYPTVIDGVQAGDEIAVYAQFPDNAQNQATSIDIALSSPDGRTERIVRNTREGESSLVERAWAQAKIASLVAEKERATATEQGAIAGNIVALSLKHRVASPLTSFLVLETEADYARFDIDRKATNLLTVVDGKLARIGRNVPAGVARQKEADKRQREQGRRSTPDPASARGNMWGDDVGDAFGAGGGGRGEGIGLGRVGGIGHGAGSAPTTPGAMSEARAAADAPAAEPAPRAAPQQQAAAEAREFGQIGLLSDGRARPRLAVAAPSQGKLPPPVQPYTGKYADIMNMIRDGQKAPALEAAHRWRDAEPGDVMALVALGEAFEANGDLDNAARAYGSIIDLFSSRADLRRFAGERLEHLAAKSGLELAIDTYEKAAVDRPDHPASHRLLAFAQLKNGHYQESFDALARGLKQHYPENRFLGVTKILREDMGLVGAAWARAEPNRSNEIREKVTSAGGVVETGSSLRFVLNWETDANDVDFHIKDASGGHAYYSSPNLPSGGNLYADVTTGYGPECFTIRGPKASRSPKYTLQAHYYSRGPMGYGMGKLQIIDHDGSGGLTFEERPFVVMVDHAYLDLGSVTR